MSGPQFEQEESQESWIKTNQGKMTTLLAALIILIGGLYLFKSNSSNNTASVVDTLQTETNDKQASTNDQANSTDAPIKMETVTDTEIKEVAQKGDGLTHLARRATKTYLESNNDLNSTITKEQKIYIEDYLAKQLKTRRAGKGLEVNEEVNLSKELVNNAIEASQKLNQKQLDNLTKYTQLVPSL
ncbi:MAG: hypothetical protein COU81_02800 [Candidatus Portnoybacteria bacterium CG10_big_fil_rev_8_21_14_0_10_36_7]|uniref:Uncharacterized protein n=1 Tax=Candidatus Portnoybacteria bacterium CG10_big_fil_rev_8_21_14_0_10_36_7 TaxID=1974812 RepID=A0A2M8KDS4_9BACT|nr:MAG: hypothetical protein COU81_02800 [Candidatus Portnoybacteria bacterium CG10_big_fil_rev_8_21_14_0_10_36_7]